MAPDNLDQHVQIVGVLSLFWGGLIALVLVALLGMAFFLPVATTEAELLQVQWLVGLVSLIVLALAALGLATGIGLLNRRAWAKNPAFVLAA